jgi:predicted FMN-binding regulatory protein PaiB
MVALVVLKSPQGYVTKPWAALTKRHTKRVFMYWYYMFDNDDGRMRIYSSCHSFLVQSCAPSIQRYFGLAWQIAGFLLFNKPS